MSGEPTPEGVGRAQRLGRVPPGLLAGGLELVLRQACEDIGLRPAPGRFAHPPGAVGVMRIDDGADAALERQGESGGVEQRPPARDAYRRLRRIERGSPVGERPLEPAPGPKPGLGRVDRRLAGVVAVHDVDDAAPPILAQGGVGGDAPPLLDGRGGRARPVWIFGVLRVDPVRDPRLRPRDGEAFGAAGVRISHSSA